MIFEGKLWKEGKFWLIEVPALDALTQGRTKKEAFRMMHDWIKTSINKPLVTSVSPNPFEPGKFNIETDQDGAIMALLLRRQRQKSGLSIRDVAKLLNKKSANAYAAYENGKREPSISQAERLLEAVSKQDQLKIRVS